MTINEAPTLLSALVLGLLGSAHCIGMCGGITSALSLSLSGRSKAQIFWLMLTYHLGRVTSYAFAGLLLASVGWYLGGITPEVKMALRYFAAIMLITMGLYLTGWWRGLTYLERAGSKLWQYIQPKAKALLPIKNTPNAFAIGLLWGWLPCGLVYSTLAWSATQGDPVQGALLMAAFGFGTIPSVFLLGAFSRQFVDIIQASLTRNLAGITIILFGLWSMPGPHQKWVMATLHHLSM
ncbi:sulfite exporter TauE/SafE family protein [Endozoicomonas ascidiicola]|uniref:sulfite exporter TauE/SafE family protein n=1 Tax=Endozoicomonas ascidiicola TaxID=1698521 RepID=UPI000831C708|nr:sulfite exporter TauE/SafE family protein [Endozoicomonas ascidiicola]